jgi:dTDP-4-amino-4,6-dideoxygalactose transaminase
MMACEKYLELLAHHDGRLRRHGDSAQGAGWRNEADRHAAFSVISDLLKRESTSRVGLLDFGCGTGELFSRIRHLENPTVAYKGVDLSSAALQFARRKFPDACFMDLDLLKVDASQLAYFCTDYCVIFGLFTVKFGLTKEEMWHFMTSVLRRLWPCVSRAIVFNVRTGAIERERNDLYHTSLDQITMFLHQLGGRSFAFTFDEKSSECTCCVWKEPAKKIAAPVDAFSIARDTGTPRSLERSDAAMVCRPLLPGTNQITPYLQQIDRRRWYTNFGDEVRDLIARLASHFGLENGQCVTTSHGTDALTAALIAVAGRATPKRPYCVMPSYTFVATPAAALNAGYEPYFVDIDPQSFALAPDQLLGHPTLRKAGAIIVVAPYGRPVSQRGWEIFSAATRVPVVIDAAAGFDAVAVNPEDTVGTLPVILSLHATKVFGAGEGGLILCRNRELVWRCAGVVNFGFLGSREALVSGFNGKMSEYHAAVGLAELDTWPSKRAGYLAVAETYRRAAERHGLSKQITAETGWASNYVLYEAETAVAAAAAAERLSAAGVDLRLWYGTGCHRQPAYAGFPRDPLPVTEDVAPRVIGLPMAVDLADDVGERVIGLLARSA